MNAVRGVRGAAVKDITRSDTAMFRIYKLVLLHILGVLTVKDHYLLWNIISKDITLLLMLQFLEMEKILWGR